MVKIKVKNLKLIDFSIMPSLKCNLHCPYCMYNAAVHNNEVLDLEKTKYFLEKFDFELINSFGFYGGEISADYDLYQKFIDLTPKNIPRFTITNGAWSKNKPLTEKFINFAKKNRLQVFISSGSYYSKFQDKEILIKIAKEEGFTIKEEDAIIPMGRASKAEWECSKKCRKINGPIRLTLHPNGKVMFANCDGIYPFIGDYNASLKQLLKETSNLEKYCSIKIPILN